MQTAYKFGEFKLLSDEAMEKSPSRMLGMSREEETKMLNKTASFISSLATGMDLDRVDGKPGVRINRWFTRDGAIELARRYFSCRSLQKNDNYLIATAALMLRMKTEGDFRSTREFAYNFKAAKTSNPALKEQLMRKYAERRGDDADILTTMDNILFAERAILYALNFSVHNDHPYDMFAKVLFGNKINHGGSAVPSGQEVIHDQWIQATSNALMQSVKKTQLCLQYPCHVICAAAMELLAETLKYKVPRPDGKCHLQEVFDVDPDVIKVVKQKLYSGCFMQTTPAPVPAPKAIPAGAPPMPTFRPVIIPPGGSVPSSLEPRAVNNGKEASEGMAHTEPLRRSEPSALGDMSVLIEGADEVEEGELVSTSRGIRCSLSSSVLLPQESQKQVAAAVPDPAPVPHHLPAAAAAAAVVPLVVTEMLEVTTSPNGTNPDSCPQSNHMNNENGSEGLQPSVLKRARCEEGEVSEPPSKQIRV